MTSDPVKIFMIVITAVVLAMGAMAVTLALWKESVYLPFKQLPAVAVSLIAAVLWCLGNLNSISTFDVNTVWAACNFWIIFAQIVFGVSLYLSVMMYRLNRLYILTILNTKSVVGTGPLELWGPVVGFHFPVFMLGMLSVIFPDKFLTEYPQDILGLGVGCHFKDNLYISLLFSSIGIQVSYCFYLNWKISRIRSAFNEFRENQTALVFSTFLFVIDIVVVLALYENNYIWNMVIWLCNLGASNALLWATLVRPIFGYLFQREEYLKQWQRGMKEKERPEPKLSLKRAKSIKSIISGKSGKTLKPKMMMNQVMTERDQICSTSPIEAKSLPVDKSPPVDKREIYSFLPRNAGAVGRSDPLLANSVAIGRPTPADMIEPDSAQLRTILK